MGMFIQKVDVSQFRGIRKFGQPIDLADFTVFIGRNNSGKSAILEALSLLPVPQSIDTRDILPLFNDSRISLLGKLHQKWSSLLYGYTGKANISYTLDNLSVTIDIQEVRNEVAIRYSKAGEVMGSLSRMNPTKKNDYIKLMFGDLIDDYSNSVFFIPNNSQVLDTFSVSFEQDPWRSRIVKSGANVTVVRDLISKNVDDDYTEFLFGPNLQIRKQMPDKSTLYIDFKDIGEGIRKVSLIALCLELIKPRLAILDDLEASIHPTLLKTVLTWLSKRGWQVVLSTHSIDVLNALLDLDPDKVNLKVVQLKKTKDDVVGHQSLSFDELEKLFDSNQDPRYLIDLLGL